MMGKCICVRNRLKKCDHLMQEKSIQALRKRDTFFS